MASSQSMSCGVCMEPYNRTDHIPKILPCQHTFCLACLLSLERSSSSMSIECPMCRSEHESSPHDFTTNRAVMDIAEELQQAPPSLSCSLHADKDSVAVCIDCLTGICVKCVNKHKDHQLEDPNDAKTLLRERFVNETRKEQSILQTKMASDLSVKEITRAENDIKEMCTLLISVITKWQNNQLSIIGGIKAEVAKQEQVLKAQHEKLESMVQSDNDISTLIKNLRKKDKVNYETLQGNTYNFVAARDTVLGELTSVITSENLVKSKFLQNQTPDATSLSTTPYHSAQQKQARQIPAGASQDRGDNKSWQSVFRNVRPQQQESAFVRKGNFQDQLSFNQMAFPGETSTTAAASPEESCPICMEAITAPKVLPCKHAFCTDCIDQAFSKTKPACPICGTICGVMKGNQPRGDMKTRNEYHGYFPGYPGVGIIIIDYHIYDGFQTDEHPNPGRRFKGLRRTAYLPDNSEGRKVKRLLRKAFDARLIFAIGPDNCVTWNGINHKTNREGGPAMCGYPDPGYLQRVQEELAAKGIWE